LVNNPPPTIQIDTGCDKPNLSDRANKMLICIAAAERSLCFEALVQENRRQLVRHERHPQPKRLLIYTHNPAQIIIRVRRWIQSQPYVAGFF
jgi:hypothetical protein